MSDETTSKKASGAASASMQTLNEERYGDMLPKLRDWHRGFLWPVKVSHPRGYTALYFSALVFCIGLFGVSVYLSYFAGEIGPESIFDVDLSLFDIAALFFIPVIAGALTFLGYVLGALEVRSYIVRRMVKKIPEDERMEIATDLVNYAHSITAVELCDIDDLCEGRKLGLSNEEILEEAEAAIQHFQKTSLQIGNAIVAGDEKAAARAFERLVGFDKMSVRCRIEAINRTIESLPVFIRKKRFEAIGSAAKAQLAAIAGRSEQST